MPHRDVKRKDFEGKTIKRIDCRAVNIFRFYFTDGSSIAIEAEGDMMVACETCASQKKNVDE